MVSKVSCTIVKLENLILDYIVGPRLKSKDFKLVISLNDSYKVKSATGLSTNCIVRLTHFFKF